MYASVHKIQQVFTKKESSLKDLSFSPELDCYCFIYGNPWISQVVVVVKNPPANEGYVRDVGSIPGLEKFPGERHSNPLQCSCLEGPVDRGVWWAIVHGVAKSWTRLKQFSTHTATQKGVLSSAAFPSDLGKRGYLCFHNGVSFNAPLLA